MFESLWVEFQVQIVPFLPHLFSFALILLPVAFLAHINNESDSITYTAKPED